MKRHIMLKLAVFLLLGAIINVAVTWGCAVYGHGTWETNKNTLRRALAVGPLPQQTEITFWGTQMTIAQFWSFGIPGVMATEDFVNPLWPKGPPLTLLVAASRPRVAEIDEHEYHSLVPGSSEFVRGEPTLVEHARWPKDSSYRNFGQSSFGFPMHSMYVSEWSCELKSGAYMEANDALSLPALSAHGRHADGSLVLLPRHIIAFGFATNAATFGAALWCAVAMTTATRGALRRRRNIKRGLCPGCGYPVGTLGGPVCTECGKPVTVRKDKA